MRDYSKGVILFLLIFMINKVELRIKRCNLTTKISYGDVQKSFAKNSDRKKGNRS